VALDNSISLAMPVHEREARYAAARLDVELQGAALAAAVATLRLPQRPGLRIYRLGKDSLEAKFEEGDFLCALSPAAMPDFYSRRVRDFTGGAPLPVTLPQWIHEYASPSALTSVGVAAIDRERRLVVVTLDANVDAFLRRIEPTLDLTRDVVLDRRVGDFLVEKLRTALVAIGNPPLAITAGTSTMQVIGKAAPKTASAHLPAAEVLWDTARLGGISTPASPTTLTRREADLTTRRRSGRAPSAW
jgi:hypothetical protein